MPYGYRDPPVATSNSPFGIVGNEKIRVLKMHPLTLFTTIASRSSGVYGILPVHWVFFATRAVRCLNRKYSTAVIRF
ncbi:hypothetical protein K449DRAFT_470565 [Hypoxylon sp. EC38]|nr:hypothetical protein K449DRAFT_470565 [Hypoxylon sp. EC38]